MILTADDVRPDLRVHDVVNTYGLRVRSRGRIWWRLAECPKCHESGKRDRVALHSEDGRWLHHGKQREAGGECSGDIFDLVAALEGLDRRRDFNRVVIRAAELAGLDACTDVERRLRRERAYREATERARLEVAAEADRLRYARQAASAHWATLQQHNETGSAYLRNRGLDAEALIAAGVVRFTCVGDPVVAIRDVDGVPVSTATRLIEPGNGPKVMTLTGCTTKGTMIDCVADIVHGRNVVLVEGVADAMSARLAYPEAVVLGANGVGNIAGIARAAVPRVKIAGTRLLLVPHDDEGGEGTQANIKAGRIAIAAGFDVGKQLLIVDLPTKDLNDAWRSGWRPKRILPLAVQVEEYAP